MRNFKKCEFTGGLPCGEYPSRVIRAAYAIACFLFCIILILVVSYATAPPSEEKLKNLTYATISEEERKDNKNSYNWKDIVISTIIIAIVVYVMIWFNGK